MKQNRRENWMDAVKTIAIFIVLLNHANVQIKGLNFWGGMFYVPVFFVLAGYTHKRKPLPYRIFMLQKAKRLLVPYFVANLLLVLLITVKEMVQNGGIQTLSAESLFGILYGRNQLFQAGENNRFFMQFLNAPTWFLLALFLSLICFEGLLRSFKHSRKKMLITLIVSNIAAILFRHFCPILLPWSIDALPYFVALMYVGYLLRKEAVFEKIKKNHKKYRLISGILFAAFILMALANESSNLSIGQYGRSYVLSWFNSAVASMAIMWICYMWDKGVEQSRLPKWLVAPGAHTLTMLCYHLFVFMLAETALSIGLGAVGMAENQMVVTGCKLVMIVTTIALFTLGGSVVNKIKAGRERN